MVANHGDWLSLTTEEILEADLPICDTHHHLWERPNGNYYATDYLQDVGPSLNVLTTVFCEARSRYYTTGPEALRPVGETEFVVSQVSGLKSRVQVAAGIVGYVDLTLGEIAAPVLEAHITAGRGRFRGIRNSATWHEDKDLPRFTENPHLYADDSFRRGFALLKKYGLSFDAWCYHTQLEDVVSLAKAFPDIRIILNHAGTPIGIGSYEGKRAEVFREWQKQIASLSACQNVAVKLGGLGIRTCGFGWNLRKTPPGSPELAEVMAPYFLWCIEKFGVSRCMFESNVPVEKNSYSYQIGWNAFKRFSKDFSRDERSALFCGAAAKWYRLG